MTIHEHLLAQGLAPRSVAQYLRIIDHAEQWCTREGYVLAQACPSIVAEYLLTQPRSYASRNQLRAALRHYWEAVGHPDPPVSAVRVPKKPQSVCLAVEDHEARVLARAAYARHDHKGLATMLGLYLALRREEISSLRWDAFSAGWLTIIGKGEVQARIPVHPSVLAMLNTYPHRSRWVFPGKVGGHISAATVWAWVVQVAKDAGLGHVPTHRLRHTCLATMNDATGDLRSTQEFARHQRPETTARYTRVKAHRLTVAMQALDY